MLGLKLPTIQQEIEARSEAALAPHYSFVRTLTSLAAGMLGLSAPQAVGGSAVPDPFRAQLSLWALLCMGSAIIFGAVALYGETNIHLAAIRWYRALLKKHNGNHSAADEEAKERRIITPPKYHSTAFWIQCFSLFVGVILLVWSKVPTPLPPPPSSPVLPPSQTAAPPKVP